MRGVNYDSKPKITLSMHPVHEAFCRYIFSRYYSKNIDKAQKQIILTRRDHLKLGKYIFGMVMAGDYALKRPDFDHQVTFILPMPNNEHGYWLRYRFIYFPRWVEDKINDVVEYEFNKWCREKFEIGYSKGKEQKVIANAILRGLNLRKNELNYDTIIKSDYRSRRLKEKKDFEDLITLEELES